MGQERKEFRLEKSKVSNGINSMRGPEIGLLLITHYSRILRYIEPQFVHVMVDGKIVMSGDQTLADKLEEKGYDWVKS